MSQEKDKYSLWMVPKGESGDKLQAVIDRLAAEHDAPRFVPHLTLVANIFADSQELTLMGERIEALARRIGSFTVTLEGYGYKDEDFRAYTCMLTQHGSIRSTRKLQLPSRKSQTSTSSVCHTLACCMARTQATLRIELLRQTRCRLSNSK